MDKYLSKTYQKKLQKLLDIPKIFSWIYPRFLRFEKFQRFLRFEKFQILNLCRNELYIQQGRPQISHVNSFHPPPISLASLSIYRYISHSLSLPPSFLLLFQSKRVWNSWKKNRKDGGVDF